MRSRIGGRDGGGGGGGGGPRRLKNSKKQQAVNKQSFIRLVPFIWHAGLFLLWQMVSSSEPCQIQKG